MKKSLVEHVSPKVQTQQIANNLIFVQFSSNFCPIFYHIWVHCTVYSVHPMNSHFDFLLHYFLIFSLSSLLAHPKSTKYVRLWGRLLLLKLYSMMKIKCVWVEFWNYRSEQRILKHENSTKFRFLWKSLDLDETFSPKLVFLFSIFLLLHTWNMIRNWRFNVVIIWWYNTIV